MNSASIEHSLFKNIEENYLLAVTNHQGITTYANEQFLKKSGFSKEEVIGKSLSILRHPKMSEQVFQGMWQKINSGQNWKGNILNRKKDGSDLLLECSISPIFDEKKEIIGFSAIYHEFVTDKEFHVEEEKDIDPISNLPNRFAIDTKLDEYIKDNSMFSIIFCQVDKYQEKFLDIIITKIGKLCVDTLRKGDYVGRWGKSRVAIVCLHANIGQSAQVADRVKNLVIESDDEFLNGITCSFGVSQYDGDIQKQELIARVVERVETSIKSGGNRVLI